MAGERGFHQISGRFYRIVPAAHVKTALDPAPSREGRFHHDFQPTLYVSSRPDWAQHAVRVHIGPDDPPRVICELILDPTPVLDLRDPRQCADWGVDPRLSAVPWLPERAQGLAASSWQVADAARAGGAAGMIYTARTAPERWHLVLFRWRERPISAQLTGRRQPADFG
ncbi:RES domain-containing protein [Rhodobacter capsulatus]|uniref:RES domain-containing protein n=1 Tax=Rhodobacter capsulatus TaxID=1061 RepID=UPI0003D2D5DD|nr:RES domain-containing protein [Rhodobacter capsulatus]ETD91196.1 hypothetical protein U713_02910 [Rhodobacter capsulatus YW2]